MAERGTVLVYNAGVAQPIQGTLIEQLRRDHMRSRDIAVALESLGRRLAKEGILRKSLRDTDH